VQARLASVILNLYSSCTNNRFLFENFSQHANGEGHFFLRALCLVKKTRGHFALSDKDQSNRFFFLLPQFPYKASPKMADGARRAKLAIQMFEPSRSAG
jgi:hypothetical protein